MPNLSAPNELHYSVCPFLHSLLSMTTPEGANYISITSSLTQLLEKQRKPTFPIRHHMLPFIELSYTELKSNLSRQHLTTCALLDPNQQKQGKVFLPMWTPRLHAGVPSHASLKICIFGREHNIPCRPAATAFRHFSIFPLFLGKKIELPQPKN